MNGTIQPMKRFFKDFLPISLYHTALQFIKKANRFSIGLPSS
ncbi:hypothetical protein AsAng_0062570 [Aureispira anguillae]|uniref:Uncharacterized protein n=1 Tax=Aureispira anguillae TaxID=2864201 RepID=A0A915YLT6_9BACT|nr:hypothetical protein AsAng_0062570 [Aureispira anguillae]